MMTPSRRIISSIVLLLLTGNLYAAKIKPITEIKQVPENEKEQALWDIAGRHESRLANEGSLYNDRQLENYLESITEKMLGDRLDHLDVSIDFIIIKEPTLSAWVYPNGTIGVHVGLLAGLENEAQLASILAHELSHFIQRHSYRELVVEKKQSIIGKGLGVLATAAAASQGQVDLGLLKSGGAWSELVTSGYSRKNEHIADAEGLELMRTGNYDRYQAVLGFTALKQNDVYGAAKMGGLWSSHPKLDGRIENMEKAVKKEKKKKVPPGDVPDSRLYYEAVAPAFLLTAKMDMAQHKYDRARAALRKYTLVRPGDPEGFFQFGESFRKENPDGPDYSLRAKAYQAAVAVDDSFAEAYKELGMTYRRQSMTAEALAAFNRYLQAAPDAADVGIIRGYIDDLN